MDVIVGTIETRVTAHSSAGTKLAAFEALLAILQEMLDAAGEIRKALTGYGGLYGIATTIETIVRNMDTEEQVNVLEKLKDAAETMGEYGGVNELADLVTEIEQTMDEVEWSGAESE